MSKELRNTPDLWIFIYILVPESDSWLLVDILASLFEEASLRFLCIFDVLQKLVLAGEILGVACAVPSGHPPVSPDAAGGAGGCWCCAR